MNHARSLPAADPDGSRSSVRSAEDIVYRKISWRVMPIVLIAYVCAFLDRINIGYAQLQMKHDLAFSDAVYGLGAGIFFVTYLLLEYRATCCSKKSARACPSCASWCYGVSPPQRLPLLPRPGSSMSSDCCWVYSKQASSPASSCI